MSQPSPDYSYLSPHLSDYEFLNHAHQASKCDDVIVPTLRFVWSPRVLDQILHRLTYAAAYLAYLYAGSKKP